MTNTGAPKTAWPSTPEARRSAARVIVAAETMNGKMPADWVIELADLDEPPVPRKLRWWHRFRRKGTAI